MKRVTMLGAGSWGTALALVLADNNHDVRMWGHRAELIQQINDLHENKDYLPDVKLPESIQATTEIGEAVTDADFIIVAVPTKAIREVLRQAVPFMTKKAVFVHVSKGIEPDSLLRISEIMEIELPSDVRKDIVVLSGPSHAEEVGLRHPTTVTSSSKSMQAAEEVQDLFINHNFRVYTNPDIIGVEIGGALKNIIALAAGITDGLGYGDNAKAALITRGLAEIARLGTKMGGNPLTFSGLTGVGDLIVTCTSVHSRNWRAGNLLGKGYKLEDVLEEMGMVVEGVRTTKAAYQLSEKYQVQMPITEALHQVLFNGQKVETAVESLMARGKTHEMEDLVNTFDNQVK
ncbi:NAD(P)H-dependent glycerol-3-phosphate dehydrogenase [Bacillus mojavensis]|uniref:Glycerol-3-phosphate dehydrogenase [NAD(P)+] n=1 Tax=Bacillus mojavensis TaxID=72360 RepID=A0AAP3CR80_BACMO|nr:NAD(P)H-dependent glycerol-3-phosphate dehydrogenase [Bacillus mojavensis]MCY8104308.1 NAD(P)H-dependent glycerol-3-phosphate dehydrogenase [Bacillus mojavensis]MCY8480482.1 NAD(P)H-dependent glycerol-3-phosphate dehydrogenase [Bacillus mojavensis]MCY8509494.1 NAD(P)H-dependent glycerol-3-phosphate dehydrogenase [Bacillus mojavensis]MCY9189384.1 NAD(P)H-dependent glycerol-3-phosphate dehydrogenase [Bacillus mojavensis]MEC1686422.1 NAD(P)H-dependent glycerol-3-phosphate dehydrogenase [Bacill